MRKAGEKPLEFYKIKLQDVLISSVQNGGAGGGIATEFVSFSFASRMPFNPYRAACATNFAVDRVP